MQALAHAAFALAILVAGSFLVFLAREILRSATGKASYTPPVAPAPSARTSADPSAPGPICGACTGPVDWDPRDYQDPAEGWEPCESTSTPLPVDVGADDPGDAWESTEPTADPSGDCGDTSDGPVDVDSVPAWYDDRTCWGCSRGCTYKAFRLVDPGSECSPADLETWEADRAYRAEHGGFSRIGMDDLLSSSDAIASAYTPPRTTPIERARLAGESKLRAWRDMCEQCGAWVRVNGEDGEREDRVDTSFDPGALEAEGEVF
jgi:hypothetical protein